MVGGGGCAKSFLGKTQPVVLRLGWGFDNNFFVFPNLPPQLTLDVSCLFVVAHLIPGFWHAFSISAVWSGNGLLVAHIVILGRQYQSGSICGSPFLCVVGCECVSNYICF